MKFIQGQAREQIQFFCLESQIAQDNDVRFIDLFVNSLALADFGFKPGSMETGRPAYHPADLLKLFLYGYLNRIRSSRQLEKECCRNMEVMWLMKSLAPDHNTISNFRRDNPRAIRKVFQATVKLARHFELIGGKLLAGDGTRLRAQNSKKNNFNEKKIEKHLAHIDQKLMEYKAILQAQDGDKTPQGHHACIQKKMDKHQAQRRKYESLGQYLKDTGELQVSTSDPESRQLITRNNITEVAYSIQSTVDASHNIPIDYKVTNQNDSKAMGNMLERAKAILGNNGFTALYDKGYHTGSEFKTADELGVEVLVAIPAVASHAPDTAYDIEHFTYSGERDTYTCPQGQPLVSNGKWYTKDRTASSVRVKHYKTGQCHDCPAFAACTRNKNGRLIERSEHQPYIDNNRKRMRQNKERYRKRQAIVEHPFGIIKRQWGFYYIMTKRTIERASADVGLVFTAFNLRRIFNLMDKNVPRAYLKALASPFRTYMTPLRPKPDPIIVQVNAAPVKTRLPIAA